MLVPTGFVLQVPSAFPEIIKLLNWSKEISVTLSSLVTPNLNPAVKFQVEGLMLR